MITEDLIDDWVNASARVQDFVASMDGMAMDEPAGGEEDGTHRENAMHQEVDLRQAISGEGEDYRDGMFRRLDSATYLHLWCNMPKRPTVGSPSALSITGAQDHIQIRSLTVQAQHIDLHLSEEQCKHS